MGSRLVISYVGLPEKTLGKHARPVRFQRCSASCLVNMEIIRQKQTRPAHQVVR